MVSKLHLATQEVCLTSINNNDNSEVVTALISHYEEIGNGIGVHKTPQAYGAFPTDPYSHTPQHRGAQQPGMTGQVKEDILTRIGELGVIMKDGKLLFQPDLLHKNEFLLEEQDATFILVDGTENKLKLEKESLAFTVCQVPVIYKMTSSNYIEVNHANGTREVLNTLELDTKTSKKIVERTGAISLITVGLTENKLRL